MKNFFSPVPLLSAPFYIPPTLPLQCHSIQRTIFGVFFMLHLYVGSGIECRLVGLYIKAFIPQDISPDPFSILILKGCAWWDFITLCVVAYEPRFLPFFFSVPSLGVLLSLAALRRGLAVRSVLVHRKEKQNFSIIFIQWRNDTVSCFQSCDLLSNYHAWLWRSLVDPVPTLHIYLFVFLTELCAVSCTSFKFFTYFEAIYLIGIVCMYFHSFVMSSSHGFIYCIEIYNCNCIFKSLYIRYKYILCWVDTGYFTWKL